MQAQCTENKRHDLRYVIPTLNHSGGHVILWRVFSVKDVGPLVEIRNKMNDAIYKDIL